MNMKKIIKLLKNGKDDGDGDNDGDSDNGDGDGDSDDGGFLFCNAKRDINLQSVYFIKYKTYMCYNAYVL